MFDRPQQIRKSLFTKKKNRMTQKTPLIFERPQQMRKYFFTNKKNRMTQKTPLCLKGLDKYVSLYFQIRKK